MRSYVHTNNSDPRFALGVGTGTIPKAIRGRHEGDPAQFAALNHAQLLPWHFNGAVDSPPWNVDEAIESIVLAPILERRNMGFEPLRQPTMPRNQLNRLLERNGFRRVISRGTRHGETPSCYGRKATMTRVSLIVKQPLRVNRLRTATGRRFLLFGLALRHRQPLRCLD